MIKFSISFPLHLLSFLRLEIWKSKYSILELVSKRLSVCEINFTSVQPLYETISQDLCVYIFQGFDFEFFKIESFRVEFFIWMFKNTKNTQQGWVKEYDVISTLNMSKIYKLNFVKTES